MKPNKYIQSISCEYASPFPSSRCGARLLHSGCNRLLAIDMDDISNIESFLEVFLDFPSLELISLPSLIPSFDFRMRVVINGLLLHYCDSSSTMLIDGQTGNLALRIPSRFDIKPTSGLS